MGQYKMICLDIDGTILNSKHEITAETYRSISGAAKRMPVILVSARMPSGIRSIADSLKLNYPIICFGGGYIVDNDGMVLYSNEIEESYLKKIYSKVCEQKMHISLYRGDAWYVQEMDEAAKLESSITGIKPVANGNLGHDAFVGYHKALIIGEANSVAKLQAELEELHGDVLNFYLSKENYLEVIPKSVSKATAVGFLAKEFGILAEQVIAIGDQGQDIDMIEFAGLGVAMGNAPLHVRRRADYITLTNDEDGVAFIIDKHVGKEE